MVQLISILIFKSDSGEIGRTEIAMFQLSCFADLFTFLSVLPLTFMSSIRISVDNEGNLITRTIIPVKFISMQLYRFVKHCALSV